MIKCYSPTVVSYSIKNGKHLLDFQRIKGDDAMRLSCGRCMACRLDYARQWAVRGEKERLLTNGESYFITLTYKEEALGFNDLSVRELQLYVKRLRKAFAPRKIRYMACGEYGEKKGRAHYHLIVFGLPKLNDLVQDGYKNGITTYTSEVLTKLWEYGKTVVGNADFAAISYVARYITKKINGKKSDDHYLRKEDGLVRQKEFMLMSRKPGIGHAYLEKYKREMLVDLTIPSEIGKTALPRYYKRKLKEDPEMAILIKEKEAKYKDDTWKEIDDTDELKREQEHAYKKEQFFKKLHKNEKGRV
nr:MAG: replication initiator protein [Microvirus sp.]